MAKLGTVTIKGKSGTEYDFTVYPRGQSFNAVAVVYAISKRTVKDGKGSHEWIYIGETEDVSTRFDNHHKEYCFAEHDADCVSIHREDSEDERVRIEDDILKGRTWPCNG